MKIGFLSHTGYTPADKPRITMNFKSLHLVPELLLAITETGYETPTPIQEQSIPIVLEGHDLLGCAQTGTGKTASFAIPTLQRLFQSHKEQKRKKIRALIITPTRELAVQIDESFSIYGKHLPLKNTVIFGGVKQHGQVRKLKSGIDILTATPGRLIDLIEQEYIDLSHLEIFILDEADRMLDMGFIRDIKRIREYLPEERQSLFFSATMPKNIVKLAETFLYKPKTVTITPVSSTAETVQQKLYMVDKENKKVLLTHVLKNEDIASALVFTRTKYGANKITDFINKAGITAEAIHGNKSQNARQNALNNFKDKKTRVLVATDIAARGIDIDDLSHVINFEIPNEPETYVHRIGRTGRAQKDGIALSFCDRDELKYMHDIHSLIKKAIPLTDDHPYHTDHKSPPEQTTPIKPKRFHRNKTPQKRPNEGRPQNFRKKRR